QLQINLVETRLKERRIHLVLAPSARKLLAREGFDATFGARPLKRTIQRLVVDPLTVKLLAGEVHDGSEVTLEAEGDHIRFRAKATPVAAAGG
ncbi:MAG: hypothetical protein L3K17_04340, partial [Thermoplasmata archaeon]|nr:hypothetical protein [Thermoplasmata archaeon]